MKNINGRGCFAHFLVVKLNRMMGKIVPGFPVRIMHSFSACGLSRTGQAYKFLVPYIFMMFDVTNVCVC